jgi:hypothetical protein
MQITRMGSRSRDYADGLDPQITQMTQILFSVRTAGRKVRAADRRQSRARCMAPVAWCHRATARSAVGLWDHRSRREPHLRVGSRSRAVIPQAAGRSPDRPRAVRTWICRIGEICGSPGRTERVARPLESTHVASSDSTEPRPSHDAAARRRVVPCPCGSTALDGSLMREWLPIEGGDPTGSRPVARPAARGAYVDLRNQRNLRIPRARRIAHRTRGINAD